MTPDKNDVPVNVRISTALAKKLQDLEQQTGLKRSALVRLILTRVTREVLATLLMDRNPHAGAQRLLASLTNGQRRHDH
jgi:antitoxin component of RelBE/YafQ-DinJ toxin-antitoxin module